MSVDSVDIAAQQLTEPSSGIQHPVSVYANGTVVWRVPPGTLVQWHPPSGATSRVYLLAVDHDTQMCMIADEGDPTGLHQGLTHWTHLRVIPGALPNALSQQARRALPDVLRQRARAFIGAGIGPREVRVLFEAATEIERLRSPK